MDSLYQIFGTGKDLTAMQMCARSFVMFFITLVLIRAGGVRMFGKKSAFDDIIVIMLGAVLSRGVVGANPFFSTVAAGAVMIAIHRLLGWLCTHFSTVEKLVKGESSVLYKDGHINAVNLKRSSLTERDLLESLRLETNKASLKEVDTACMETNGRISFILKNEH